MAHCVLPHEQLLKAISCDVCLESYFDCEEMRRARALPCGHTYCHACVCSLLAVPLDVSRPGPACPACRSPLPTTPAALLPRNYALESVASVVRAMGSDVWMAAALVHDAGASVAQVSTAISGMALEDRSPDVAAAPPSSPDPEPLHRCRVATSRPVLSRSALALAAGGVSVRTVIAGIGRILESTATGRLPLSQLADRIVAESTKEGPTRLWPPTGFLPAYYGSRCLAVPAAALERPDVALLRAFVQWAGEDAGTTAAAAAAAAAAGSRAVAGASQKQQQLAPLHVERSVHGSLAEVVCRGGRGCALLQLQLVPPARTVDAGATGIQAAPQGAAAAASVPHRYIPPAARARMASASSGGSGGGARAAGGRRDPLDPYGSGTTGSSSRRWRAVMHADDYHDDDDDGSGECAYDDWQDAFVDEAARRGGQRQAGRR
jgi:hypothetical protein